MTTPAIEVRGLTKSYGSSKVLDDVSFAVPTGGIVGVIGPSGAGKTTAIRLMTGAIAPDTGTVRVLDEDPRRFRRRTRVRIGYMPQLFVLYPDLTASELADLGAGLRELAAPYVDRTADADQRPAGARPVSFLHIAFPLADEGER